MVAYRSLSVLTLVRGRQGHLDHLVAGLAAQVRQPDELVVAYMQPDPPSLHDDLPFAIRAVRIDGDPMPLARARNEAAAAATGGVLAFLDVDCIPDPAFCRRAVEASGEDANAVFLPEVRYLPGSSDGWLDADGARPDYRRLIEMAERHPAKPEILNQPSLPIDDFGELWGLAFILSAAMWRKAGGMDEAYVGYGAEETDFGRRLERAGASLHWLGGTLCFHQHHPVHKPPLQHFDHIVRNAALFRERWGEWCMDYWLDDFAGRGLIKRHGDRIEVLRQPTREEMAATLQGAEVRFS